MNRHRRRSILVISELSIKAFALISLFEDASASQVTSQRGSTGCPLDISVLWTADVESPVYSTPAIIPLSPDGRKQIAIATLRQAVELLEGDGTVPHSWPIELDGSAFHASPVPHDVDGDGVQDFCVADTSGEVRWLTPGERGPYMPMYRLHIDGRRVTTDQYNGLLSPNVHVLEGEGGGENFLEGTGQKDSGRQRQRRRLQGFEDEDFPEENGVQTDIDAADGAGDGGYAGEEKGQHDDVAFPGAYGEDYFDGEAYGWGDDFGDIYWGQGYMDDYDWNLAAADTLARHDGAGLGRGADDFFADAHVLAAPVFADVDGGGGKEMIIPVSYFRDPRYTPHAEENNSLMDGYVSGSLLCWDVGRSEWLWTHDLGETVAEVDRGYVYASPTVADLEGDGSLEVIVGTSLGALHVLDAATGEARSGFPIMYGSIRGQVSVADVDGDGLLEMMFGDSSGVMVCLKPDGTECWNRDLSGAISSTVTMGDVDGDGDLDAVVGVTTSAGSGEIWALNAETGETLPHFPVRLVNRKGISTPITLVDLHERTAASKGAASRRDAYSNSDKTGGRVSGEPMGGHGPGLHLLSPSEDGHVYVVEGATGCVNKIDLGERLLSMVLADDVDGDGTLDLLVGTLNGEVVALSANVPFHPLNAWSSEVRGQNNGFVHGGYQGVHFTESRSKYDRVVGRYFSASFEIVDASRRQEDEFKERPRRYQITISAGKEQVFQDVYDRPGIYKATLSLETPGSALLRIEMVNGQGLTAEDHVNVGYNTGFHAAIKWMLVAPVALASLLFVWMSPGVNGGQTNLPA